MRITATSISISTNRTSELAAFYARLLGVGVAHDEPGWAQIKPEPDKLVMTINFEFDEAYVAPVWPSEPGRQQPQQHLDIWVDDLDEATEHAVACGATVHPHQVLEGVRVMLDPDAHPFCLFVDH